MVSKKTAGPDGKRVDKGNKCSILLFAPDGDHGTHVRTQSGSPIKTAANAGQIRQDKQQRKNKKPHLTLQRQN
ncbi:hypothetical protein GCM10010096_30460 [Alcaligenes pakistanensis]|uniref:Uncharacterized protein n=1 Tax=Alcaligenes pakistanensis TaxID=1482717 RepID=A0A8H9M6Q4_9BURK|nr:hypothetical protein [Alcaligenes pakistanensis]GHC55424.1 hypothetical protein GCM10010096_30460 [Alcaligenes pakistanensis]